MIVNDSLDSESHLIQHVWCFLFYIGESIVRALASVLRGIAGENGCFSLRSGFLLRKDFGETGLADGQLAICRSLGILTL